MIFLGGGGGGQGWFAIFIFGFVLLMMLAILSRAANLVRGGVDQDATEPPAHSDGPNGSWTCRRADCQATNPLHARYCRMCGSPSPFDKGQSRASY